MAYSVIDKVYTIFIDVMTGSSNGYGKPTFYNTDSHTSFIELTVTNGSKEFNMTEFSYMFTVEKPDGTKYTNEYTTQDKSKLVIPVDAQMISCTGNCNAQLYVNKEVDGVNKTLTMVEFNYTVYKGLHEGLISESVDFDNVYVKILNKLDYIINNGADLTGDQAAQLSYAYQHSKSPHAPANIVETMHTEIGEAIDAHHKKVALSASQVGSYSGTDITVKPSQEGLTSNLEIWGRTLQNVCVKPIFNNSGSHTKEDMAEYIKVTSIDASYCYAIISVRGTLFDANKPYTLVYNREDSSDSVKVTLIRCVYTDNTTLDTVVTQTGKVVASFTPKKPIKRIEIYCYATRDEVKVGAWVKVYKKVMILGGDYTTPDAYIPPYFEGIKSVGEPTPEGGTKVVYGSANGVKIVGQYTKYANLTNIGDTYQSYVVNCKGISSLAIELKDEAITRYGVECWRSDDFTSMGNFISEVNSYSNKFTKKIFELPKETSYIKIYLSNTIPSSTKKLSLDVFVNEFPKEPYQEDTKEIVTNISDGIKGLTTTVADALYFDRVRQELWSKQMVGVYTFTGNESIRTFGLTDETTELGFEFLDFKLGFKPVDNNFPNAISNRFKVYSTVYSGSSYEGIALNQDGNTYIRISKDKLSTPDVEGFKAWLKANPITIYYELANPKYTKVSSSNTNLKTFVGTTHVFSKNAFKPRIAFGLDFVPMTTDAKQFCSTNSNKNFILPDVSSLQEINALEIHLFVKVLANVTLSFPSKILWDDSTKLSNIAQGSVAEFIFTYIKTADGGSWLGTVVPHK